jgi:hypothetical protein
MTTEVHVQSLNLSRRRLLRVATLAAGGGALACAGLVARPATAASPKLSQKAAGYQATPNGKLRCDTCMQWKPPASCQVVEGVISPSGWCKIYVKKS